MPYKLKFFIRISENEIKSLKITKNNKRKIIYVPAAEGKEEGLGANGEQTTMASQATSA
jgi:hypothetical protein